MEHLSKKIWKYMDLAKFVSLLSKEALYFACPFEFDDPFEGYSIPPSWILDELIKSRKIIGLLELQSGSLTKLKELITSNIHKFNDCQKSVIDVLNKIDEVCNTLDDRSTNLDNSWQKNLKEEISVSGVSCWHRSEYESEAMWKLYTASGQGIALESTVAQLKASMMNTNSLEVKSVSYISEEDCRTEYLKHDLLFLKRKSFEHEKELRAKIQLKDREKGEFVECNLNTLITRIHVSPLVDSYFKEVVEDICNGKIGNINKPVIQSSLLDKPNFKVTELVKGWKND